MRWSRRKIQKIQRQDSRTQSIRETKRKEWKSEDSLKEYCDNIKQNNIHIIGAPEGGEGVGVGGQETYLNKLR